MLTVGIIFVSAFGIEHCVTVNVISGLCLLPPIACAAIMFFMPDSPYYLITKGKISEAEKALSWFRGGIGNVQFFIHFMAVLHSRSSLIDVKDELAEMQRAYQDQQKIGSVSFVKLVTDKVYLQPFLLMLALMFFQQFSGINAVNFNLVSIFQDVGSEMDEGLQGFIINIAQTCGCGLAVVLVDKLGRKPLLSISGTLMSISIFGLGAFFYLKENQVPDSNSTTFSLELTQSQVKDLAWLPLVRETLSRFLKNVFQTLYYCFRLHWLLTLLVFLGVLVPYPGPSIQKCFPKKSKIKEHQSSLNSIGFAPF